MVEKLSSFLKAFFFLFFPKILGVSLLQVFKDILNFFQFVLEKVNVLFIIEQDALNLLHNYLIEMDRYVSCSSKNKNCELKHFSTVFKVTLVLIIVSYLISYHQLHLQEFSSNFQHQLKKLVSEMVHFMVNNEV